MGRGNARSERPLPDLPAGSAVFCFMIDLASCAATMRDAGCCHCYQVATEVSPRQALPI